MNKKMMYTIAAAVFLTLLFAVIMVERMPVMYAEKSDVIYLPQQVSKDMETAMNAFEKADQKKDNIIGKLQKHIPGLSKKIDDAYTQFAGDKKEKLLSTIKEEMNYVFEFYAPMESDLRISVNGGHIMEQRGREAARQLVASSTQKLCIEAEKAANILVSGGGVEGKLQLLAVGPQKQCWYIKPSHSYSN